MRCWLVPYLLHVLRNRSGCSLFFCFQSINLNDMYHRILSEVFTWAKTHGYCGVDFEERVSTSVLGQQPVFRVCVSTFSRFSSNVSERVIVLVRIIDAFVPKVSVASVYGSPNVVVLAYVSYLGSGYQQEPKEYPFFDLRRFKCCLQQTTSSVFGTLDPYFMTKFIVKRLKIAIGWPRIQHSEKAIITSSFDMSELVEVVADMVGVWPLINSFMKETGQKDDGLVVRSSSFNCFLTVLYHCLLSLWCLEEGDGCLFYLDQLARLKFRLFHMVLENCKCMKIFWCRIFWVTYALGIVFGKYSWNALELPVGSTSLSGWISRILLNCTWSWRQILVYDVCFWFSWRQFCPSSVHCWVLILCPDWGCPYC